MKYRTAMNRKPSHNTTLLLTALFCLTACQGYVGGGNQEPVEGNEDAGTRDPTPTPRAGSPAPRPTPEPEPTDQPEPEPEPTDQPEPEPEPPAEDDPVLVCNTAPERAEEALTTYCAGCHGDIDAPKANFGTILDVSALIASGKVIKDNPAMSPIYKRISTGSMPPDTVTKRPDEEAIAAIKEWIDCGAKDWKAPPPAALPFISIDTRLREVLNDLRSFSNPAERERLRYFDLTALSNAGVPEEELQVYREALSYTVNSLSRGRNVVAPEAINENALIYRIDLRDYVWDEETWNLLEQEYPYAVIYDEDSNLFPFDETTAERLRDETGTTIPVIQADWFVSHAARPPLYNQLLDLPNNLAGLEQDIGVDFQDNIINEQIKRAGFADAGNSQNNRVIERHELGGGFGGVWISYDFANNLNQRNVFTNPLDFQQDVTSVIFALDNGMQGFFLANAAGNRLDKAPNNVLQDPRSRDGAVELGLSCMNCHQSLGIIAKADEIRDFQQTAGANAQEIAAVLGVYPPREEMFDEYEADQELYESVRNRLEIEKLNDTSMHDINNEHLGTLDVRQVAGVLGLRAADFKRSIDATPQVFPAEIVTLRANGGSIPRDAFEAIFEDIVEGLGLGESLDVEPPPPPNVNVNNNNNN